MPWHTADRAAAEARQASGACRASAPLEAMRGGRSARPDRAGTVRPLQPKRPRLPRRTRRSGSPGSSIAGGGPRSARVRREEVGGRSSTVGAPGRARFRNGGCEPFRSPGRRSAPPDRDRGSLDGRRRPAVVRRPAGGPAGGKAAPDGLAAASSHPRRPIADHGDAARAPPARHARLAAARGSVVAPPPRRSRPPARPAGTTRDGGPWPRGGSIPPTPRLGPTRPGPFAAPCPIRTRARIC